MLLLGFGYKKRVGKDTAVKFALSYLRQKKKQNGECYYAYRASLFDPVKYHAYQLFKWGGLQDAPYYDDHPEKKEDILPPIGRSPRQIWDELGSTIRNLCPRTLPEVLLSRDYEKLYGKEPDILLIPDVRGPEEYEYIKKFHGKVFCINRKDAPISQHIVDNMLNERRDWDGTICNDGTMKEFYNSVISAIDASLDSLGMGGNHG